MMNKTLLSIAVAVALVPCAALAVPMTASSPSAWGPAASMPSSGYSIRAGYAPIDQALATIVPAPYRILIDRRVSRSAVLVWRSGNDWMHVLTNALAPMGLSVRANWSTNTVEIFPASAATPALASAAAPLRMPASSKGGDMAAEPLTSSAMMAAAPAVAPHPAARALVAATPAHPAPAAASTAAWPAPTPRVRAGTLVAGPVKPVHPTEQVFVKGGNNRAPVLVASTGHPSAHADAHADGVRVAAVHHAFDGPYVLPAGEMLSRAMAGYAAKFGWHLQWLVGTDYKLTAPFPVPRGSLEHGVLYIVTVYQSQGGMLGVQPFFYAPNHVVAIRHSTTRLAGEKE